jgi:hypothetical protein
MMVLKAKKIPYYLLLLLLTVGASLIIGFLSFGGMFALWPILPLAFGAFALSVAYEGEIYLQNIKGALNKLFFKRNYLEHQLAREYLLTNFPNTELEDCPQFFKDYKVQLELLHKFGHHALDKASQARKQKVQKTLADMEKWFALQLYSTKGYTLELTFQTAPIDNQIEPGKLYLYVTDDSLHYALRNESGAIIRAGLPPEFSRHNAAIVNALKQDETLSEEQVSAIFTATAKKGFVQGEPLTNYQKQLRTWLSQNKQGEKIELLKKRTTLFKKVAGFSIASGLFMGLGTSYLLVGEFAAIPVLAAIPFTLLPLIILPMAVIAGAAYALLTYNAATDMISNDTLRKWYYKMRNDLREKITFRKILIATSAVFLLVLAVALTLCTAGTWWTIAKNARPLFGWMGKIPGFVMGVINPLVTGASALIFNVQNTSETFEVIDGLLNTKGNLFQRLIENTRKTYEQLRERENLWQIFNPFRILLKLTITPLRILLFLGHLVSIGVTADRVPGIPEIISALLGIISEGFEDLHYFFEHHHHHGHEFGDLLKEHLEPGHSHSHSADIPTRLLKAIFSPLYLAAATWAWWASKRNVSQNAESASREELSFKNAWLQQTGQERGRAKNPSLTSEVSRDWKIQHGIYLIERYKQKHLNNVIIKSEMAIKKANRLTSLQDNLRGNQGAVTIGDQLEAAKEEPYYNEHRLFSVGTTRTKEFLDNLTDRIDASPAA